MSVTCSVYKTTDKSGKSYYAYKIKDPISGAYKSEHRIHNLQKKLGIASIEITSRQKAFEVINMAEKAGLFDNHDEEYEQLMKTPLADYLRHFWDWENSQFLKAENSRNPGSIHKDYAFKSLRSLVNYVLPIDPADPPRIDGDYPRLQRSLLCSQITTKYVQQLQDSIMKQKKIYTWFAVEDALQRPLSNLIKKGVLKANPLKLIDRVKLSSHKSQIRGALDSEEMKLLVEQMNEHSQRIHKVIYRIRHDRGKRSGQEYEVERAMKLDRRVFLAVTFSAYAGLRQGEILALRTNRIRMPKNGVQEDVRVVDITESYARKAGFKCTKNGDARKSSIPGWLADELLAFGKTNPWHEDLIFYSDKVVGKPVDHKVISEGFNKEVAFLLGKSLVEDYMSEDPYRYYSEIVKKGEEERKRRRIVFHSERRFFDNLGVRTIGKEKTSYMAGQRTPEIVDGYINQQDIDVQEDGIEISKKIPNPFN